MQELTEIRSPLENLQEISKRIQDWQQVGFKFFIASTDKHPTTCTGLQLNPVCGRRASARSSQPSRRTTTMAVTAFFNPTTGQLTVMGDNLDNTITISRNAAGVILINGGAVAVQGGTPTVANTALITGFGLGGNDTIMLDESIGALPAAQLFGGAGNDTLIGGSGADMLFGQSGN